MPAKPVWYGRLDAIIAQLEIQPRPFVDCGQLEHILGIGRRRAQQLLAPCISDHVGPNGIADRAAVITRLRQVAGTEGAYFEQRRRSRLAAAIVRWNKEILDQPPVLVEAPVSIESQDFTNLPEGVTLSPGRIVVEFDEPNQGLYRLLALAKAIGNDRDQYDRLVGPKTRRAGGSNHGS